MTLTFIEAPAFTSRFAAHFADDEAFRAFQNVLLINPVAGDVIAGTGGIRKIRWSDSRRGKGKRGGIRVLYLHIPEVQTILLMFVYSKNELDDMKPDQRRQLTAIADALRQDVLQ